MRSYVNREGKKVVITEMSDEYLYNAYRYFNAKTGLGRVDELARSLFKEIVRRSLSHKDI